MRSVNCDENRFFASVMDMMIFVHVGGQEQHVTLGLFTQ